MNFYKKIGLTTVRNEQDIIEPFVRHNLQFVDMLFVADNNSTDETRSILTKLARETERVVVFDRFSTAHTQEKFLTSLMQSVVLHCAPDFVFFLDADEFIGAKGAAELDASIAKIPEGNFGRLPWRTYILRKGLEEEDGQDPPKSMQFIRSREPEQFYKVVYRPCREKYMAASVSEGNHVMYGDDGETLPYLDLQVPMLHFPVRSEGQLATKSINGWMALLQKKKQQKTLSKNEGFHWRQNFERAVRGELKDLLADASVRYSVSRRPVDWEKDITPMPHGISYERRYSDGSYGETLAHVARGWELSVRGASRVFSEKFHGQVRALGKNNRQGYAPIQVDVPFWRLLVERFSISSALEFNTGTGVNLRALSALGVEKVKGANPQKVAPQLIADESFSIGDVTWIKSIGNSYEMVSLWRALTDLPHDRYQSIASAIAAGAKKLIVLRDDGASDDGTDIGRRLATWQKLDWAVDVTLTQMARTLANFSFIQREAIILRPVREVGEPRDVQATIEALSIRCELQQCSDLDFALYEEAFLQ